jgi:hypothetical protein
MTAPRITVAAAGHLLRPDPNMRVFVHAAGYGIARFIFENVLPARPDLKRFSELTFDVVDREFFPDEGTYLLTLDHPELSIICCDLHLTMDGISAGKGDATVTIPFAPARRTGGRGFGLG